MAAGSIVDLLMRTEHMRLQGLRPVSFWLRRITWPPPRPQPLPRS